jgi:hypothetical protein
MPGTDAESRINPGAPLAGAGGTAVRVQSDREPYEVLDDLMSVIEVLCPTWPRRGTFIDSGSFLL